MRGEAPSAAGPASSAPSPLKMAIASAAETMAMKMVQSPEPRAKAIGATVLAGMGVKKVIDHRRDQRQSRDSGVAL